MDTENSAATENLAKTPDISESVQTTTPVIGRTPAQPQAPKDVLRPRNVVFAVVLLFVLGAATVTWGQLYHQLTAYNNPAATPVTQFTEDYDELLAWAEEYNDYESTPAPLGSLTTPTPVPYSPLPTNTYSGQQCIFDDDPDEMKIDVDLVHDAISSLPLLAIQEDAQKDFNTNYYGFYWIGGSCFTPSYYCMVTYADHPEMLARYAYFNFHAPEKADNVSWDAYYDTRYPAEELRQMLIEQFEVDDVFLAAVDNYFPTLEEMDYDPITDTFKALGDFGGGGPYYYTFDAGYQDTAHSRIILHGHGVPDAEYCSRDIDGQTCSCPVADKYVIMKRAADGHFYYVSEMVRPREPTYLIN